MFLNCDGWENFGYDKENYHGTTGCGPYFSDETPKPTNKFAINSQTKFNEPGKINTIPIVEYHEIAKYDDDDYTSPELFYLEMQYLYDNGFKGITINDLGYDKDQDRFYVKNVDKNLIF